MLICQECHDARQNRKYVSSQPLQFTGYEGNLTTIHCPDCQHKRNGHYFEYLSASELLQEYTTLKENQEQEQERITLPESFPVQGYHSLTDMLERSRVFPSILNDPEAFHDVLRYAAELEQMIERVQP